MDTCGQEHFDSQNRLYYRRADCCLLVYDITNKESFNDIINFYIKEINDYCIEDIKVILLGNKTDLKNERKISTKEGTKLAAKHKFYFMETSCEENYNVADAFETIIIMTNNEMIKTGRMRYEAKKDINNIKLTEEVEENQILRIKVDDNLKNSKKKKKKKCC